MTFDLKAYLGEKKKIVDRRLREIMAGISDSDRLKKAMEYSLMAGGKRVRPVLCMAAAEAVGGKEVNGLDIGCAIEMIHTYSLIHDDLPALDNDDLRRGRATCHKAFDEATAILAGDALLTHAFTVLSGEELARLIPADSLLSIVYAISRQSGCMGMIEGQMRDIEGETKALTRAELESVHLLKTGALIEVSVRTGAIAGGGSPGQIMALSEYAKLVGLAFQVADDVLNVEGDPELLGKAVGTDEARNKSTYPSLLGLEGAKEFGQDLVSKALQAVSGFDNQSEPLRVLAQYIVNRKK